MFRPPSEAQSLILPVTNGCSWNRCTYCEMYTAPQKKFALRDEDELLASIQRSGELLGGRAVMAGQAGAVLRRNSGHALTHHHR
ncbi:MAG: hypothetical protein Q8S32_05290 [Burkholderiaceae bacterium]|nr:hypothetical protein [Burkholderiaceae bacterium]